MISTLIHIHAHICLYRLPCSSAGKESTCNAGDSGFLIPGLVSSPGEGIDYPLQCSWTFLMAQIVKKSTCSAGNLGWIPGLGRSPGEGHGNLLQNSCLENPYGQRSLTGNSSWGCKELDTTEQLSTAQHIHLYVKTHISAWVY